MEFHLGRRQLFHISLVALLLILLYYSFLLIKPFATYLAFSMILSYLLYPVYHWILGVVRRERLASGLTILLTLFLIIVPSFLVLRSLVGQARNALSSFATQGFANLPDVLAWGGISLEELITDIVTAARNHFVSSTPDILGSIADIALGLFIMFFIMFYALTHGKRWFELLKQNTPLSPDVKERLFSQVKSVTSAVMYGQLLTAIIQGALGGVMLFLFGIPNPVFWGFIMVILSFIPFLGTPLVWAPIAIIELVHGRYVSGIGILVVGGILVTNIDNVIRPRLIGSRARLSTPVVLLGVLGGLKLFGLLGLVLGPLIFALLQTVLKVFNEDWGAGKGS